jgi:hypothetical protein
VLASSRDDDGGLKAVRIFGTFTYRKPGQVVGPGLVSGPAAESVSSANIGEQTARQRITAINFDLKGELVGWTSITLDVWVEGENFAGQKVTAATASVVYPTQQPGDTRYIAYCRKARVPIPPDFALSGTAWQYQGDLQTNLLAPGQRAQVWTYSDPIRRGACVALPRDGGSGDRSGIAGIICQSAATGRACFWDSRERDDNDPNRDMPLIDWNSQPLQIARLKDASNLNEAGSGRCTDCHRGNNVFLMAPDDPIWAKVMRGPLATMPDGKFTTRVEASADVSLGHPRYIPVTFPANRPDWVNAVAVGQPGCGASCHELHQFTFASPYPMPPVCAGPNDPEPCYQ